MTKILVLGGTGFLGSNVVSTFKKRGYQVEASSRRTGIDARDEHVLYAFLHRSNPDIVVHCAAHVGGIAYNAKCPLAVFEDNLMLGFSVVRAVRRARIQKLVNIMPNCTYPGDMELYTESAWWEGAMHPTVVTYGMPRKALWVHAAACQQEEGLSSIHLVLPNLFGPHDHFDSVRSHALGALIRKIVDAKKSGAREVEVWGTGNAIREWMYAEDAAEGIALATEQYNELAILNLGSGKGCTIRDLAEMIAKAADWPGKFIYNAARPDGAPRKILDTAKMSSALGDWKPPTKLKDGIRKTVEWWIKNSKEAASGHSAGAARSSR